MDDHLKNYQYLNEEKKSDRLYDNVAYYFQGVWEYPYGLQNSSVQIRNICSIDEPMYRSFQAIRKDNLHPIIGTEWPEYITQLVH
jgi:hypothetical protein